MDVIAWDVDDVLNELMGSWLRHKWRTDHPECTLTFDRITENPPHRLLGVTKSEYLHSLTAFRMSAQFQETPPVPEVRDWFEEHGAAFRHIAVTATPSVAASACVAWVTRHFGKWIRTFHFAPSVHAEGSNPDRDESKAAFLNWLGKRVVLIDDSGENIADAEKFGIEAILFQTLEPRRSELPERAGEDFKTR